MLQDRLSSLANKMKKYQSIINGLALGVFTLIPLGASAATQRLSVPIPNVGNPGTVTGEIQSFGQYLTAAYKFSIILATFFAIVFIVYSAVQYIASRGDTSKIMEARDRITNAVYGLLLLIGATLILQTINPDLTILTLNIEERSGIDFGSSTLDVDLDAYNRLTIEAAEKNVQILIGRMPGAASVNEAELKQESEFLYQLSLGVLIDETESNMIDIHKATISREVSLISTRIDQERAQLASIGDPAQRAEKETLINEMKRTANYLSLFPGALSTGGMDAGTFRAYNIDTSVPIASATNTNPSAPILSNPNIYCYQYPYPEIILECASIVASAPSLVGTSSADFGALAGTAAGATSDLLIGRILGTLSSSQENTLKQTAEEATVKALGLKISSVAAHVAANELSWNNAMSDIADADLGLVKSNVDTIIGRVESSIDGRIKTEEATLEGLTDPAQITQKTNIITKLKEALIYVDRLRWRANGLSKTFKVWEINTSVPINQAMNLPANDPLFIDKNYYCPRLIYSNYLLECKP